MTAAAFERASELRHDALTLHDDVGTTAGDDLSAVGRTLLAASRTRLEAGEFLVTVCGEYGRGKSSLINALIGRPDLLPVGVGATTSAVLIVRWGPEETATVRYTDTTGRPRSERIAVDRIGDYASEKGNPRNHRRVQSIAVTVPSPVLRRGLVLVDTPGLGTLYPEHTAVTNAFLPRTDAILFVSRVLDSLLKHETEFLTRAGRACPAVIVAATWADRVYDAEAAVGDLTERVGAAIGADRVSVTAVSSSEREYELEAGIGDDEAVSGFPQLEARLWQGLASTCAAARIGHALDQVGAVLRETASPIANELAGMAPDMDLDRARRDIDDARDRAETLRDPRAPWRRDLRDRVGEVERELRRELDQRCKEAKRRFKTALDTPDVDARKLLKEVCAELGGIVDEVETELVEQVCTAAAAIAERNAVPLTVPGAEDDEYLPVIILPKEVLKSRRRLGWLRSGFRDGFNVSMQAGSFGLVLGGLVGGLVNPGIAVVSGLAGGLMFNLAGFLAGAGGRASEHRAQFATLVAMFALPELDREILEIGRRFDRASRERLGLLETELESEITRTVESLDATVRRLEDAAGLGEREHAQRLAVLGARAEEYRRLHDRMTQLRERATLL